MDDPWYLGKFWVGGHDHYRSIFFFLAYILANNRYIDIKLSAYNPWGLSTTSRMSWMTLGTWVSFGWVGMITTGLFSCLAYISSNFFLSNFKQNLLVTNVNNFSAQLHKKIVDKSQNGVI